MGHYIWIDLIVLCKIFGIPISIYFYSLYSHIHVNLLSGHNIQMPKIPKNQSHNIQMPKTEYTLIEQEKFKHINKK